MDLKYTEKYAGLRQTERSIMIVLLAFICGLVSGLGIVVILYVLILKAMIEEIRL